jgi:hypothetical protein
VFQHPLHQADASPRRNFPIRKAQLKVHQYLVQKQDVAPQQQNTLNQLAFNSLA